MVLSRHCFAAAVACIAVFAGAGCGNNKSSTTPTTPAVTTPTPTPPSITEEWNGTVPVSGSVFYSFSVTEYGTVNLTLASVSGQYVPSTVTLGLGLGVPNGTDCATTTTVTTRAGASAQVAGAYAAGVYCAKVFDVGNLYAPATFSVTIAHP